MSNKNVYIPSIDAKDIYISNKLNKAGYSLYNKYGNINFKRFINSLDYSLDLIKLREIYKKKYRRKDFSFTVNKKDYSSQVINVTFKYAVKNWNEIGRGLYCKLGYDINKLKLSDNICIINGELVAIRLNSKVKNVHEECLQETIFTYRDNKYVLKSNAKTIKSRQDLRYHLYKYGFYCDGVHYIRMKRSSGSARVGKCLFINEELYKPLHKWELCGLTVKQGQEIDLAALESYISLTTSSIIDTIEIKPENILVIDDYISCFKENVIATKAVNGWLKSGEETVDINNSIWDGQGLLDSSMFKDEYSGKSMFLLRNLFFKCCCFNTNIQQFFQDNNITSVKQLNGFTVAKDISDIKLITTPSSIKYCKFSSLNNWLNNIDTTFGIVKYDKKTHFFDGNMVQTHYQLLNTLQLSFEDMSNFLKPSLDFAKLLQTESAVLKQYIKYPKDKIITNSPMMDKNAVVYNLMNINSDFVNTIYYRDFVNNLMTSYYKNIKNGHVYVNGNYSTLLGNPMEMLYSVIGKFDGNSILGKGNIHSKRFEYGKIILGSRSPHVTMGNVLLSTNIENKEIDKYFNLSEEIVCVNSIGENLLQRLSGADLI